MTLGEPRQLLLSTIKSFILNHYILFAITGGCKLFKYVHRVGEKIKIQQRGGRGTVEDKIEIHLSIYCFVNSICIRVANDTFRFILFL